jgi:radical SAM protein with 4Fe4S-binding SPASM domain
MVSRDEAKSTSRRDSIHPAILFYILLINFPILMKQGFKKASNLFVSGYSYCKSVLTGNVYAMGMPPAIGTELTNHCNLKCPECASGSGMMTRQRGFMDQGLYEKVISELSPYVYNVNLYFQGEPMLHPRFFSFLEMSRNLKTVVSTNGHFLSDGNPEKLVQSGLSKLIISLDGTNSETYSAYRCNGSFDTVIGGIKTVAEAKRRLKSPIKLEIQFLVNKLNENQIFPMRKLAKELEVTVRFKSMQVAVTENIGKWMPSNRRYSRYRLRNGTYSIKSSLPDRCSRMWFNPVITWDGKVVPCCFDKDAEYIMGDLNHNTFRDIWYGREYMDFRRSILKGRKLIGMCRNCTSGLRLLS